MRPEDLLKRMEDIAKHVSHISHTCAVLGLGSMGKEQHRLDAYSDLDFFVITDDEYKQQMIEDLSWLSSVYPIGYAFRNTIDGYKVLFTDGIFAEFAIFSKTEVPLVAQQEAHLFWKKEDYQDDTLLIKKNIHVHHIQDPIFHLEEALTNLFVGLSRALRGEKLSGLRFIEGYAVDHIINYIRLTQPFDHDVDVFNLERRLERHYPELEQSLPGMLSGYLNLNLSATHILSWINHVHQINPILKTAIQDKIKQLSDIENRHKET
ncbi:MAG TPA: hypothetical protein PLJ98_02015 [Acholeplasmataceae bacterium]|nr:hypothetical protein [Acholeplasmataceae bacterium]